MVWWKKLAKPVRVICVSWERLWFRFSDGRCVEKCHALISFNEQALNSRTIFRFNWNFITFWLHFQDFSIFLLGKFIVRNTISRWKEKLNIWACKWRFLWEADEIVMTEKLKKRLRRQKLAELKWTNFMLQVVETFHSYKVARLQTIGWEASQNSLKSFVCLFISYHWKR